MSFVSLRSYYALKVDKGIDVVCVYVYYIYIYYIIIIIIIIIITHLYYIYMQTQPCSLIVT